MACQTWSTTRPLTLDVRVIGPCCCQGAIALLAVSMNLFPEDLHLRLASKGGASHEALHVQLPSIARLARNQKIFVCGTKAAPLGPLAWNAAQRSPRQLGRATSWEKPKGPLVAPAHAAQDPASGGEAQTLGADTIPVPEPAEPPPAA